MTITPDSNVAYESNLKYTFQVTLSNNLPQGGYIIVELPPEITISNSQSVIDNCLSGSSGALTCAVDG